MKKLKYFSMFSGIGGFEIGIQRAFENRQQEPIGQGSIRQHIQRQGDISDSDVRRGQPKSQERHRLLNGVCIGYSEIDKYAIQTYEKNFGKEIKNYGDATTINTAELPDFDLLVGGFPCQAFSVAGKRAGFNDTRGTLIFDVVRILRDKRPRYFVLENVKGLLSHDSGKTFSHILEILTDSGYDVSWSVHNSKNYGVPQNRERIYLIGSLRGEHRPQVFPLGGANEQNIKQVGNIHQHKRERNNPQTGRVYSTEGVSPSLSTMQGGGLEPKIIRPVLTPDRVNKRQNGRRMKDNGESAFTVTSQDRHGVYDGAKIRRLTPTECLRLQGFPDDWFEGAEVNGKPISDSQKYKCCGNAVTVNVVEYVVSEMFNPTQS